MAGEPRPSRPGLFHFPHSGARHERNRAIEQVPRPVLAVHAPDGVAAGAPAGRCRNLCGLAVLARQAGTKVQASNKKANRAEYATTPQAISEIRLAAVLMIVPMTVNES